jgi:hypothetical protein
MSQVIWKSVIRGGNWIVWMPAGAKIVHAGDDGSGSACIWYSCNPDSAEEMRTFTVIATGQLTDKSHIHLGTFKRDIFVWHIMETT